MLCDICMNQRQSQLGQQEVRMGLEHPQGFSDKTAWPNGSMEVAPSSHSDGQAQG